MARRVIRQHSDLAVDHDFWNRQKKAMGPERRLWVRCLEDAIECVTGRAIACGRIERQRIVRQEMRWFASKRIEPGSYLWVCGMLNYDPGTIREELAKRTRKEKG